MDVYFNSYKIKYNWLSNFFKPIKDTNSVKKINIFINLDDLFHTLHKPMVDNVFKVTGDQANAQMASNIFNLIGHYRNWAIKEGLDPTIIAFYTSTVRKYKNGLRIKNYRKRFIDLNSPESGEFYFLNRTIRDVYAPLEIISKYIPGVYIIDSKYLEPSAIPLYISREVYPADWNILISRDVYDVQYAYKDKWSLLYPKGDNSIHVGRGNLWDYVNIRERIYKDPITLSYDTDLYILSKSIVGDAYRNIPRLRKIGWKTLFKYLDQVNSEDHSSSITSKNALLQLLIDKKVDIDEMNNNIYAIDVEAQVSAMMEIDKASIISQLKDIPDDEGLKNANNKFFSDYPINLQFLRNSSVKRSPFDTRR